MDVDRILAGLDERQREATLSTAAPLLVVAPAGSGKTRVLTSRIAHRIATGDAEAGHVLSVTFTRKAALELRHRLRSLGLRDRVESGTFHSIALAQLRDRWASTGRSAPMLLDRVRPVMADAAPGLAPARLGEVVNEIGWARAQLVTHDGFAEAASRAGRRTRTPADQIVEIWKRYDDAKTRSNLVDFDDLLAMCTAAIEGDPAFGAAQRWRFRHLFVDEFQDVNPLQFALLDAWRGDRSDVFLVGDPYQSIYGWNGAEPELLATLASRWPALERIDLLQTHRSTPQITAAAAAIVAAAGLAERHPTSTGAPGPRPSIRAHDDEVEEAIALAHLLRQRRPPGGSWRDFAVLARTQDQVAELERALTSQGIPVHIRRQSATLGDRDVRRVLGALSGDDRPLRLALDDIDRTDRERAGVAALLDVSDEHLVVEPQATGRSFASWARASLADDASPDAVTLSTMHAAKGLEWGVVHVVGVEDGTVPLASARRRAEREEEARLLYVAATRAERELTFHWCRVRTARGVSRPRERSPFLEGFEAAMESTADVTPDEGVSRIAALRSQVKPPVLPDPVTARLQAWRRRRARATQADPTSLLPDDTIAAICAALPKTLDELADVTGFGAARIQRYGSELLDLVAAGGVARGPLRAVAEDDPVA